MVCGPRACPCIRRGAEKLLSPANSQEKAGDHTVVLFIDYDAPLTEAGHYTAKYDRAAEMLAAYDPLSSLLSKPERPAIVQPFAYFPATMNQYIDFEGILAKVVGIDRCPGIRHQ